jgi:3-oxoacyl-[acyl-carrier protein] reductase
MNLDLKNKNALICGSTAGIGQATAKKLAEEGVSVTLVARNEEKLENTLKQLACEGEQKHDYIVADFSKPGELREKVDEITARKNYHLLLNNTGGPPGGMITDASTDEFEKAFQMHLICNQIIVKALLPGMKKNSFGRIVNIISTSVKQPLAGLGVSNSIRGAVANWSKTLATEIGEFGITVNNVLPGATETGRLDNIIANKAKKGKISEEQAAINMKSAIPAKRFGKPEELADAISFLMSERAGYINGINLPVDGGRTKSL